MKEVLDSKGDYRSILLVRLRAVGEVVMTLPVLDVVRRNFPKAHIAMLVESPCEEIFSADERVDEMFVFDKPYLRSLSYAKRMAAFWSFVGSLRKRRFDLAIDLHNVSRSQWLTFLSGARKRVGVRTRGATHKLHNILLDLPRDTRQHNIARYIHILKHMGMSVDEYTYEMRISSEADARAEQWIANNGLRGLKKVAIHPGAAHIHKCWPTDRFARLGDILVQKHDADVIITCGPGEHPLGEEVRQQMKSPAHILSDCGLQQLGAILSKCDLTISNDTGPTHISSVVGTPTIAVIGPTNPFLSGPATTCSAIVWAERYCSPCYRHMFTCPLRKCFAMIEPEMVLEKAERMIANGHPKKHQSAVPGLHPRYDFPKRSYIPGRI